MKKLSILISFVFILFSSISMAETNDDLYNKMVMQYPYTNITTEGSTNKLTCEFQASAIIHPDFFFTGSIDYMGDGVEDSCDFSSTISGSTAEILTKPNEDQSFSIFAWVYLNATPSGVKGIFSGAETDSGKNGIEAFFVDSTIYTRFMYDGVTDGRWQSSTTGFSQGTFVYLVMQYNSSDQKLYSYYNETLIGIATKDTGVTVADTTYFEIGNAGVEDARSWNGLINFMAFNDTLTQSEIEYLKTYNIPVEPESFNSAPSPVGILNISDKGFNTNVTFTRNDSIDPESDDIEYYWYINESLQQINGTTYTTTQTDGYYNLRVDVTDGEYTTTGEDFYYRIDTSPPLLNIYSPVQDQTYSGDMLISSDCQDDNLYRLNHTITTFPLSTENATPISDMLILKQTIDTTLYSDGSHTVNFECADTHTKQVIKNKVVTKDDLNKKLKWKNQDNYKEISIYPDDTEDVDDFYTIKQIDRYTFDYKFKQKKDSYVFNLISDEPLTYLGITEEAGYSPHFITSTNWIDFNLDYPGSYIVDRVSSYHYRITIITDTKELHFKSIGDLNIKTDSKDFIIDNTPPEISVGMTTTNVTIDTILDFTVTCTDISSLSYIAIYDNDTLLINNTSPISPYNPGLSAQLGTYGLYAVCSDDLGQINMSDIIVYTGNPIPPPSDKLLDDIPTGWSDIIVTTIFILASFLVIVSILSLVILEYKTYTQNKKLNIGRWIFIILGIIILISLTISSFLNLLNV